MDAARALVITGAIFVLGSALLGSLSNCLIVCATPVSEAADREPATLGAPAVAALVVGSVGWRWLRDAGRATRSAIPAALSTGTLLACSLVWDAGPFSAVLGAALFGMAALLPLARPEHNDNPRP